MWQYAIPAMMGLGGAALPWLMRNPRVAPYAAKLGKKVFTPATEAGGKPGGFVGRHPIISGAGLGYAGTTAGSMMAGSPDQPTDMPTGDVPLTMPGVVPAARPEDDFTSSLPSLSLIHISEPTRPY